MLTRQRRPIARRQQAEPVRKSGIHFRHGQRPQAHAERDIDRLQLWLDHHGLKRVKIRKQGQDFVDNIKAKDVEKYSSTIIDFVEGAALGTLKLLFSLILVIVISVYMLLDAPRLSRFLRRVFRGGEADEDILTRIERALLAYVKGQTLVSLVIGTTAGVGLGILGVTGVFPGVSTYALGFGAWAAAVEVIPYVGPWLGALAPLAVASTESATAVVGVALLFLFIHQIEGHIVIPKLMGSAVKVHPLVVIFALLAAGELYGLAGILIAMPLVAVGREMGTFLGERIGLQQWPGGPLTVDVPVAVHDTPPPSPAEPATSGSDPNVAAD